MYNYRVANRTIGHESSCKHLTIFITRVAIDRLFYYLIFLDFISQFDSPSGPSPPHCRGFMIALRHVTLSRTPLDERSARRKDFYLTTHNTHTKDRHPFLRRYSNPQSQQANGRRLTPQTARMAVSALDRSLLYLNSPVRIKGHGVVREQLCERGYSSKKHLIQKRCDSLPISPTLSYLVPRVAVTITWRGYQNHVKIDGRSVLSPSQGSRPQNENQYLFLPHPDDDIPPTSVKIHSFCKVLFVCTTTNLMVTEVVSNILGTGPV